ncbi:MAG: carboxymuconolactone decarboxylase family protein [Bacteriovoracaceae bacterium]
MKKFLLPLLLFTLFRGEVFSQSDSSSEMNQAKPRNEMKSSIQSTYDDITKTLGLVPSFLKEYDQEALPGAWQDMKGIQLNANSAIPPKYKELIGVAVSAQIPCRYCSYFHTEAAKVNKASNQELKEAIVMAASTRRWSTFLQGTQSNLEQFKSEVDNMLNYINQKNVKKQAMEAPPVKEIKTNEEVYRDMQNIFGFVPSFMKDYPVDGLVGAWKEMKAVELNANSALSAKYKHLIGLAVSAQVPCNYCIYYHTQAAMSDGATKAEITEAVAMAGLTRQWSTVLNGQMPNDQKFKKETDAIMKNLRNKSKSAKL